MCLTVQGKSRAKHQRYSVWSLPWPFKGRGLELQTRRKGLLKQNPRQQSTKNFLPPDWRSRGTAEVRVWLRRDQGSLPPSLLQHRLLLHKWSSYFAWVFVSIIFLLLLLLCCFAIQQCCFITFFVFNGLNRI